MNLGRAVTHRSLLLQPRSATIRVSLPKALFILAFESEAFRVGGTSFGVKRLLRKSYRSYMDDSMVTGERVKGGQMVMKKIQ